MRNLHALTIEFYAPDFDCYVNGDTNGPAFTDQEVSAGLATPLSTDYNSSEFRQPLQISYSLATEHIPPIPFWSSLTQPQSKTRIPSEDNDTIEHTGMDW